MLHQINVEQWADIINLQKTLDAYILQNVKWLKKDLVEAKILALKVELSELANEVRSFKFWSKKPRSNQDIIGEEYVDGLHFLLSLGLDFNYDLQINFDYPILLTNKDLNKNFLEVFSAINNFYHNQTFATFEKLLYAYLFLGFKLNLSFKNIYQWYIKKNSINHDRQKKKY